MPIVRRSFSYLRPYGLLAAGAFVAMLLVTAANLAAPQLIAYLIDNGIAINNFNGILQATLGLLGVAIVRGLFNFLNTYWSETVSQGIAYDLRNQVYAKLETLSFSYHDQQQTGQLMTRATSDVEGVRTFFAQGLLQLISAIFTFIGSAVILFATDWRLALAALATIPLIIGVFVYLFSQLGPRFARVQQRLGALNTVLQENIAGVRVVKAFTAEPLELQRYRDENEVLYDENIGVVGLTSIGFPTVFLLANIGTVIVIWYGGNRVISEALSLGTLIAFNSYLSFLLFPIFQVGFISQQLSRAIALGGRLFEIIDTESELVEKQNAILLEEPVAGHVRFENVSFQYIGGETAVLQNISFDVPAGQTVALLGPTGSGKSSVINLIPRFYDPTEGSVVLDGHDLRDLQLESLRERIGIVLQDVNLIGGTIRDNIAYGKLNATEHEVQRAARAAQAHSFIMQQPNGYDTVIGERGVGLSGGQRQRIAIARAILTNPCLLIFDDSTSAVDADTESKIQRALSPLLNRLTAFVVAQRISTVRNADTILLLDEGKLVAQGTHKELLEHSALYAEIVYSQLEQDEEEK